jgi:hypothetical protein
MLCDSTVHCSGLDDAHRSRRAPMPHMGRRSSGGRCSWSRPGRPGVGYVIAATLIGNQTTEVAGPPRGTRPTTTDSRRVPRNATPEPNPSEG